MAVGIENLEMYQFLGVFAFYNMALKLFQGG